MRGLAIIAVFTIGACGDNLREVIVDAAADVPGPACVASFTGNFAEASSTFAACAKLDLDTETLELAVPSSTLGTSFQITIALGPSPSVGVYSSETTTTWRAIASEDVGGPECIYLASDATLPRGSFTLTLDQLEATSADGTLDLLMYVLTPPFTDCGPQLTEILALRF